MEYVLLRDEKFTFTMVAVLIYIFLNFLIGVESQSFLNVDELSLLQYGLEIANEPVLFKEVSGYSHDDTRCFLEAS